VLELLNGHCHEIRNSAEFREGFLWTTRNSGRGMLSKGSELISLWVFKPLATQQYAPVREFRRRVRLALEEQPLFARDPNRVVQHLHGQRCEQP